MHIFSVCHQNPSSLIYLILSVSNSRTTTLYLIQGRGGGGHNLISGYSLTHSDSSVNSKNERISRVICMLYKWHGFAFERCLSRPNGPL